MFFVFFSFDLGLGFFSMKCLWCSIGINTWCA